MNRRTLEDRSTQPASEAIPDNLPSNAPDIPSRRAMLRGALAAGCGLLLPASLIGCSKKDEGSPGSEPTAPSPDMVAPANPTPAQPEEPPPGQSSEPAAPPPSESAAPATPGKASQASVQYQDQPKDGKKCADCMHFVAESNTCRLVEGKISPSGWCVLWTQKA
ncbi:MAG: high-potential iron-sulfur protein [Betaproteobacteria bacterium]|nr:high-potential iron-sulfur protein [Betaproteobacteria bacterium]